MYYYECEECGARSLSAEPQTTCSQCSAPLRSLVPKRA
jgi:predicted nucleic acid-binding Zn ribbon protein